jgi:hypothetical protein
MSRQKRKSLPPAKQAYAKRAIAAQVNYKIEKQASDWSRELKKYGSKPAVLWSDPYKFEDMAWIYCHRSDDCIGCIPRCYPADGDYELVELVNVKRQVRHIWQSTALLIEDNGQRQSEAGIDQEDSATVNLTADLSSQLRSFFSASHVLFEDEHADGTHSVGGSLIAEYLPEGKAPACIREFVIQQRNAGKTDVDLDWLGLVFLFSKFWIRDLSSFTGSTKKSLIDYLFALDPVPEFLYDQWTTLDHAIDQGCRWQFWTVMIGQGLNLRNRHPKLTKGFQKHLVEVPWALIPEHQRNPSVATMAAEAKRLGASDRLVLRLARNAAFAENPIEMPWPFLDFFRDTVAWFVQHDEHLSDVQADEILAWAVHMHTEKHRELGRSVDHAFRHADNDESKWNKYRKHPALFRWRGRTAASAANAARRYHDRLLAIRHAWALERLASLASSYGLRGSIVWNAKGWDRQWTGADEKNWEIIELCTLTDLIQEGATLHHCVATYAGKCIAGTSRIFSLRRDGSPQVTIEVDTRLKQILQARGMQNRLASRGEMDRIQQWISGIQKEKSASSPAPCQQIQHFDV